MQVLFLRDPLEKKLSVFLVVEPLRAKLPEPLRNLFSSILIITLPFFGEIGTKN